MITFSSSMPRSSVVPLDEEAGTSTLINPELSIICVNWNSLDYLLSCVSSIYENTHELSFEIIVFDNASSEGKIETVTKQFPRIKLIKSDRNVGFAAGNNLAFRQSLGQYILLLNPDTKLIGPAINIMLDQIKALPDAGIIGCKLLNTDLSTSTSSIHKFPTILNQLLTVEWLRLRFPKFPLWAIGPLFAENLSPTKVEAISGACMMLKRDVFERAGLLNENYFMYAEDIDLNYNVRQLGFSSYYIGNAQIVHHGGRSSSRHKVSQWSTVMTCRATSQFFKARYSRMYAVAYRFAMGFAAVIRLALLAVMFLFGDREGIGWAATKWSAILKWAIGIEQIGAGR
jgi:N-acetylglucosaminyl-diphospho-decaprenol L-rhamnosyltransferase